MTLSQEWKDEVKKLGKSDPVDLFPKDDFKDQRKVKAPCGISGDEYVVMEARIRKACKGVQDRVLAACLGPDGKLVLRKGHSFTRDLSSNSDAWELDGLKDGNDVRTVSATGADVVVSRHLGDKKGLRGRAPHPKDSYLFYGKKGELSGVQLDYFQMPSGPSTGAYTQAFGRGAIQDIHDSFDRPEAVSLALPIWHYDHHVEKCGLSLFELTVAKRYPASLTAQMETILSPSRTRLTVLEPEFPFNATPENLMRLIKREISRVSGHEPCDCSECGFM